MIKLYGIPVSNNVNKIRYCLNYLNLPYEWIQTNPMTGDTQSENFLKINPIGKIPALEDDGFPIFESNAIIKYLASKQNSSIYPQDLKQRVVVDEWIDFVSIHIGGAITRVLFNRVMAPMLGKEVDQNSLKTGLEFLAKYLPICDKQLAQNKYLTGSNFTLADINLLAVIDPCEMIGVSLSAYPNLTKWRNELKAQNFYQKCFKAYGQFVQEMMSAKAS